MNMQPQLQQGPPMGGASPDPWGLALGGPPGPPPGGNPGMGMPGQGGGMDIASLLAMLTGGQGQGMPMEPGGMPGQGGEEGGIMELLAMLAMLQQQGGQQGPPSGMSGAQGPMPQGNPLLQSLGQSY